MDKKGWRWIIVMLALILFLLPQCQQGIVKEEMPITPEKERAVKDESAIKEERALKEEKEARTFEESLTRKKYPGIAGEVMESALLKDIHFEFDKFDLTEESRKILAENANVLVARSTLKIQIEGHCDERGSNEYNLALGEKRAVSAKLYMIKLGVQGDRLSTISYGEEMPMDQSHNEAAWAKNRRCHFVILSR
jgi:peptidoglycan-associated lipoprotein